MAYDYGRSLGLQSVDEPLNEQLLVLPTLQLQTLKREWGDLMAQNHLPQAEQILQAFGGG